jgi:RND family efflux transporter MFP subunit
VAPAPGADLVVVAPEAARILEIPKAEGDSVRRGDVLVHFEIPGTAAEVSKQRAEITRAEARLTSARSAETRARDLFDRGVAARKEVEDATKEVADAEADIAAARAGAAAAETVASRSTVRAAFDGVVARRAHNPGDVVEATASDVVLRVIDPRRLEVVAAVPVADAAGIKVGAAARLTDLPEGTPAPALKVVARPVAVQPGTVTVSIRLAFVTPATYPVGAPVQVEIDRDVHKGTVLVPSSAVLHQGEETIAFVVAGEKAQRREVKLGIDNGQQAEVASGIADGEQVVVTGQNGLPDGAKITTGRPGAPAPAASGDDDKK